MEGITEIKTKVVGLICDSTKFDVSELAGRESENLHTGLGIDSLSLLEIALSIDNEFQADFSDEELLGMESINRAAEMVDERLQSKKAIA